MQILGLNKTTLLDYPGRVAATIFLGGCNFCCPFCHNKDLVLNPQEQESLSVEEVLTFLHKRRSVLTGVCITGGEPTLQAKLPDFLRKIKELGYFIKIDTNGTHPEVIRKLYQDKLIDFVAMDIKSSKETYEAVTGNTKVDIASIEESILFLINSGISYEFRTTVVKELHNKQSLLQIAQWIKGCEQYFLQSYVDGENVINPGFSAYSPKELQSFVEMIRPLIPTCTLRGVDL